MRWKSILGRIWVLPAAGGFPCPCYTDMEVSTTCVTQDTNQLAFHLYETSAVKQTVALEHTESNKVIGIN